MKIQKITDSYSNDFSAVLECEHCAKTQRLTTGYNDAFYHNRVIPFYQVSGVWLGSGWSGYGKPRRRKRKPIKITVHFLDNPHQNRAKLIST